MGILAGIEVRVGELQFSRGGFGQQLFVIFDGENHAGNVKVFRLVRWNFEVERLEWAHFGHKPEKECQQTSSEAGTPVALAPFLLVIRSRQIIAELARFEIRSFLDDITAPRDQRHSRHLWNDLADGAPES